MISVLIAADYPVNSLKSVYKTNGCSWLPQIAENYATVSDIQIHWVILNRESKSYEIIPFKNQQFHILPYWGLSKSLLTLRIREWWQFRCLIKKINPDIIHCWGTENSYAAAMFSSRKPTILSMQGIISAFWKTGRLSGWHWWIMRFFEPISIKKASIVTCESRWGLNHLKDLYPSIKTKRIEYGANSVFYDVSWQPDFSDPYFVFVGSLDHRKGVDILISMLEAYPHRSWKIVFAGMGPYYEDLKKLTSHNVEVLGSVAPAHISDVLQKACGLVLPTRADTSPNVVKEARVIGLPVISTSNGGQASYIQHGVDGYIIDSEDPHEWHAYLDELANNEQLCRKFGAANHDHYRSILHPQLTAEAFIKLYKQMLDHE